MVRDFLNRINMQFFQYKWMDAYHRNKEAIRRENAVFTWNGMFFMLVVDISLIIFYSFVKDGDPEAIRYICVLPIVLLTFWFARLVYRQDLPEHFLTVGISYAVGTLILFFCSFMIIDPEIQASFYGFFLVTTLLTTLIVDVPTRKLSFLLLWDVWMVTTAILGIHNDPTRMRSVLVHGAIVSLSSFLFGCFTSWRKLQGFDSARELTYISTHDRLTGLRNREKLYQDYDVLTMQQRIRGVMIFDINSFKHLNDTYGHVFGDQAIQYVAGILRQCEEHYGIRFYRYGGDEFVGLILPVGEHAPDHLIPHIKKRVTEQPLCTIDGATIQIQVSGGFAEYHAGDSLEHCVNLADDAMYADKEQMKKEGLISKEIG